MIKTATTPGRHRLIKISSSVEIYIYVLYTLKFQILCLMSAFCFLQALKQHHAYPKQRREKASFNSQGAKRWSIALAI